MAKAGVSTTVKLETERIKLVRDILGKFVLMVMLKLKHVPNIEMKFVWKVRLKRAQGHMERAHAE